MLASAKHLNSFCAETVVFSGAVRLPLEQSSGAYYRIEDGVLDESAEDTVDLSS